MRVEAQSAYLGRVGLDHIVNLDDQNLTSFYKDIVSREFNTTQSYWRVYQESGFQQPTIIAEGTTIPEDDLFTGYLKDITPTKRALGFSISTEASESDQYGALANIGAKLRNAFRRGLEQAAANVINLATTTTGPDAKALAANDHPLESGSYDNLATAAAFGPLALEDMLEAMRSQEGHRGDPDPCMGPFILYVHPDMGAYARRVVGADKLAGTGDNDKNDYIKNGVVKVCDSPYFTDTNFFAIRAADNSQHGLSIVRRRKIKVKSEEDIDKDAMKYRATEMYACYHDNWRGYRHNEGA